MSETQDVHERLAQLEKRIEDLEQQLQDAAGEAQLGTRDRYDGEVLADLSEGDTYHLKHLLTKYERAGVRDRSKIKSRIQHLERSGLLERDGTQRWRFVGGDENT